MSRIKKISVVGAGAIGTLFGGLIKRHNPDVEMVLIARGEHCRVMRDRGYAELCGAWGRYEVPVTASSDPADVIDSDLVLFTVKTQDTLQTAKLFAGTMGNAVVVSLQNGINQRILSNYIRPDRLLVGMTATNMTITKPGVVSLHRNGVSVIGPPTPDVPATAVEQARQTLASSGLKFEASNHIVGVQYNKLLFNTMGYASVLSASDFIREGMLNGPWRKNVAIPLLSEGMAVLKQAGIPLERASGMSDVIRLRRLLYALNAPGLDKLVRSIVSNVFRPPRLVFSVYHDLLRQKVTEIDFVNGEIVRLAQECSMEAPYNAEVVRRVHAMEASSVKDFPAIEKVIRSFRELRPQ
jgi:2-dehydropantoate 2-reductase